MNNKSFELVVMELIRLSKNPSTEEFILIENIAKKIARYHTLKSQNKRVYK